MLIILRWPSPEMVIINEIKNKLYFHLYVPHKLTSRPQVQDHLKMNVNMIKRFMSWLSSMHKRFKCY